MTIETAQVARDRVLDFRMTWEELMGIAAQLEEDERAVFAEMLNDPRERERWRMYGVCEVMQEVAALDEEQLRLFTEAWNDPAQRERFDRKLADELAPYMSEPNVAAPAAVEV
jgi:hypothetical protein